MRVRRVIPSTRFRAMTGRPGQRENRALALVRPVARFHSVGDRFYGSYIVGVAKVRLLQAVDRPRVYLNDGDLDRHAWSANPPQSVPKSASRGYSTPSCGPGRSAPTPNGC